MILAKKEFVCEKLPTAVCHASTLLKLKNGNFLVAWFGGSKESEPDVDIWVALKKENMWQAPFKISVDENLPHWNPVLFQLKDKIALYFKVGKPIAEWKTYVTYSDDGIIWSKPVELVKSDCSGGRGPVKNKPIRLNNGTILAPASVENGPWRAFCDISYDDGKTWKKTNLISAEDIPDEKDKGVIQPTLWQDEKGVHMLLRSSAGFIYKSDSVDNGKTWSMAYKTDLLNNNSGIDLVKLNDGRLVLVCNPVGENFGARTPLSLFISSDGQKWIELMKLEWQDGEKWSTGEFSYPAIIADGKKVYITYTYQRKNVAFWEIEFA